MYSIAELNKRFGIADKLEFTPLADGLQAAHIQSSLCEARVSLQGAQVLDWTPAGEKPVVWLSPGASFIKGKSVRGGVPVCWPWFGAHEAQADYPAHGFARTVAWEVLSSEALADERVRLHFRLLVDDTINSMWPDTTPLELTISMGKSLELELLTRNEASQPIRLSEALHTYFAVGDIRQVHVSGLEDGDYLDKTEGFARKRQQGDISFNSEVDRVYLATERQCVIDDPVWQRRIVIDKRGSRSTVVWNPWLEKARAMGDMGEQGYLSMVCVESGNAASDVVTIAPGDEHRLWVQYKLES